MTVCCAALILEPIHECAEVVAKQRSLAGFEGFYVGRLDVLPPSCLREVRGERRHDEHLRRLRRFVVAFGRPLLQEQESKLRVEVPGGGEHRDAVDRQARRIPLRIEAARVVVHRDSLDLLQQLILELKPPDHRDVRNRSSQQNREDLKVEEPWLERERREDSGLQVPALDGLGQTLGQHGARDFSGHAAPPAPSVRDAASR